MDKNETFLPTFLPQYNAKRQFSHISYYFHFTDNDKQTGNTDENFYCGNTEETFNITNVM